MRIHTPSYYAAFRCAAGACPDTCCRCWEVVVDEAACRYYQSLPGPLGEQVRQCLRTDGDGETILAFSGGGCPLRRPDGLCSLQKYGGEEALPLVCRRYPRFRYEFGAVAEEGISLSCPAACRLILETPFSLSEREDGAPPSPNDIDPVRYYAVAGGRRAAFRLVSDQRFPIAARTALLLSLSEELEGSMDASPDFLGRWQNPAFLKTRLSSLAPLRRGDPARLFSPFRSMEPLTPRFPGLLASLTCCPLPYREETTQRILEYFLYKYFLQAAYDGKLLRRVQFAAASLLMAGALFAAFPPANRTAEVDLLHCFSREVEHSEDNLSTFFRWAGKRRQPLFYALLLA